MTPIPFFFFFFFFPVRQNSYEQQYDYPGLVSVTKNVVIGNEFAINIKEIFDYLQLRIGEANETDQRFKFVGFSALYVFHYKLFRPALDKKFFKLVFLMHKKLPIVSVYGNVPWVSSQFFTEKMGPAVKELGKSDAVESQRAALKKLDESLPVYSHFKKKKKKIVLFFHAPPRLGPLWSGLTWCASGW